GGAGDLVHDVDLAGGVVAAAPGAHHQTAVGQPVHAGDLRFEALGTQVGQGVVGAYGVEREAVAGRVPDALALLAARGGHPDHSGIGAQCRVRDGLEAGGTRRLPGEVEHLVTAALEVVDAQCVHALGELHGAVLGLGAVQSVVVDDELVVD